MKLFLSSLLILVSTALFAVPNSVQSNHFKQANQVLTFDIFSYADSYSTNSGSNSIELSWPAVSGASAYIVEISENGSKVYLTTTAGTSKSISGLEPGHIYHCTVSSIIPGNQPTDYIIAMDVMP